MTTQQHFKTDLASSAKTLIVNGTRYAVKRASDKMISLIGQKGGEALLVRNIHSGAWALIVGSRETPIRSLEEAE
jgi:hypothetical protein